MSKFLLVVAAAAASVQVSEAFLTSHFVVNCGQTTDEVTCWQDPESENYFVAPQDVFAWKGEDLSQCYTFGSSYDPETSDGQTMCAQTPNICSDITNTWSTLYSSAANVVNGAYEVRYLGCSQHDETVYQLRCASSGPQVNPSSEGGYDLCNPSGSWGTATWYLYFAASTSDCLAGTYSAVSYDYYSGSCGSASTVTRSVLVTILSIAAALKTVF